MNGGNEMKNVLAKIFAILASLIISTLIVSGIICAFMESVGLGIASLAVVLILTIACILNS